MNIREMLQIMIEHADYHSKEQTEQVMLMFENLYPGGMLDQQIPKEKERQFLDNIDAETNAVMAWAYKGYLMRLENKKDTH